MGDWSTISGSNRTFSVSVAFSITTAAHVKCDWVELLADTDNNLEIMGVFISLRSAGSNAVTLFDIGMGATGSEQTIISNLMVSGETSSGQQAVYFPLGGLSVIDRLVCRAQSTVSLEYVETTMTFIYNGWLNTRGLNQITTYGIDTSTTRGVSIDPGAVVDTYGSWTEITSATTHDITQFIAGIGNQENLDRVFSEWVLQFGIGAAASEVAIAECVLQAYVYVSKITPQFYGPVPVSIPSGTRLSARAKCNINDATDRLFDLAIYGIN